MTTVDGLTLPVRVAIAGDAFDLARDYARTHGLTISEAVSEMLRQVAPLVADTDHASVSPGDGREGAATATAAPSVLTRVRTDDGPYACTEVGSCNADAWWKLAAPGRYTWGEGDEDIVGRACCDDHIPDGWVRPDDAPLTLEESKALHPSSLGPVEYVKACVYCGERSAHGRCS